MGGTRLKQTTRHWKTAKAVRPRLCRLAALCIAALCWWGGAEAALAHQLYVFAAAEGNHLQGRAYFRGGTPCVDCAVESLGPDGTVLHRTRTDENGNFTVPVTERCDHRLVVDGGMGHAAEYVVTADELIASVSSAESVPAADEAAPPNTGPHLPAEPQPAQEAAGTAESTSQAPASVAREVAALRAQIARLQNEIAELRSRLRFQDLLGGVGYILGVCGIAFYLAARRNRLETKDGTP